MRALNLKSLFLLIALTAAAGKINAQNGLYAVNTMNNVNTPNQVATQFNEEEKVRIGDLNQDPSQKTSLVRVNSLMQLTMQVKVFDMNGDLAKIETHNLNSGVNDLNVDLSTLSAGTYMVQFYTKEGSAIRRFVKSN